MNIGKFKIEDLNKLHKTISLCKSAVTFTVSMDGPKLLVNYTGDDGKLVTVTLFNTEANSTPTITKTDYLV